MEPDTTTPDPGVDAENGAEPAKGMFVRIGLLNGQQIVLLTTQNSVFDGAYEVFRAENGEEVSVRSSQIAYIRETEIDMPTEAEIAAYEEELKLLKKPKKKDDRTHEDLVREFQEGDTE